MVAFAVELGEFDLEVRAHGPHDRVRLFEVTVPDEICRTPSLG